MAVTNPHIFVLSCGVFALMFAGAIFITVKAALAVLTWKAQHDRNKDG